MLKKILIVLVVIGLSVTFGCKKSNTDIETKNSVNVKQTEKDGKTTTETVKKEVIKQTETAVKDANAAK
jgi:regulatory protein YycH of two-component signal transduction system YycFG